MIILVLNCGSSSIKYQVIDMRNTDTNTLLAKGIVERIGMNDAILTHKPVGKDKTEFKGEIANHTAGIDLVIKAITDPVSGVIESLDKIDAVGHRVVHAGERFAQSVKITPEVVDALKECVELAPLHNPANIAGIEAVTQLMPSVPQVGCFDTAFHQTMPAHSFIYGLPYKYYDKFRIRRYGFHGTSHQYVSIQGAKFVGLDIENSKIITCHIGNGGSVAAVKNGKSIDTSMGFTPEDGLIMGTRCGEIDPGAVKFIVEKENKTLEQVWNLLNKDSGLLGLSELSSDLRDIDNAKREGNEKAQLAFDAYCYRIKKYIGAYAAAMGGVDLVVFTGGGGENDSAVREAVCRDMEFLGIEFNYALNDGLRGKDEILSTPTSKVKVAVVCTNEELMIAIDTFRLA